VIPALPVALPATLTASVTTGRWVATVVVVLVVAGIFWLMGRGLRGRRAKHDLPPLPEIPQGGTGPAELETAAAYLGTTVSGDWLDRVEAQGLGGRGLVALRLGSAGVDVRRAGGGFRIPREAVRGARHDQGIAGKVVPPHGVLVVTWQHGDLLLDTGFRLDARDVTAAHNEWISRLSHDLSEEA
jgi:hypothetical protein